MLAECISILTENVNMQMEAEWADLFDRRLMSLYGIDSKNPTKMDLHGTQTKAKHKIACKKFNAASAPQCSQTSFRKTSADARSGLSDDQEATFEDNLDVNITYLDTHPSKMAAGIKNENIRSVSGKNVDRHDLPIKIDSKCLAH